MQYAQQNTHQTEHKICPECGHSLETNTGYVTWCEECDWNIHPQWVKATDMPKLQRFQFKLGIKHSERLWHNQLKVKERTYPVTWKKIAAYLISTFVYAVTLGMGYMAFGWLFFPFTLGQFGAAGLFMCLFAITLCPSRRSQTGFLMQRRDYPNIYRLLDSMADKLRVRRIDSLHADYDYNAYYTVRGIRRKPLITIGVPLFSILTLQEKVAILGHEMGHHAHKDVSRRLYIGYAQRILVRWHMMVFPRFMEKVVYFLYWMLGMAIWEESQRAEYYADHTAAELAGSAAAVSSFGKLHYSPTYEITLDRVAQYRYSKELFEEFKQAAAKVPDKERLRLDKIQESSLVQLDSTHPPTKYRVSHLKHRNVVSPMLQLSAEEEQALEAEFLKMEQQIQRYLLADYRTYYGYDR